jgi:uncharacterized protein with PQ loop repeat
MNVVLNALVISATVLGSGMALPQARQLARTRSTDGVSPIWVGVSLALNGWWFAYGLAAQVWALVPVSLISFLLYLSMAVVFLGSVGRPSVRPLLVGALGLGMIPLPFLVFGGWASAGLAVGFCYGVQLLPAVVSVLRSPALGGVSAATWLIALIESMLWLAYGVAIVDAALLAAGLVGVAMSSVILVKLAVSGHRPLDSIAPRAVVARWRNAQPSLS